MHVVRPLVLSDGYARRSHCKRALVVAGFLAFTNRPRIKFMKNQDPDVQETLKFSAYGDLEPISYLDVLAAQLRTRGKPCAQKV